MATIECTLEEFYKAIRDFREVMCSPKSTQDDVALAHKCLVLHYLGCEFGSDDKLDSCAIQLEACTNEALRRGWHLIEPDLSGDNPWSL